MMFTWSELDRESQDKYLRLLWQDGYSEGAIAEFFSIGKGAIVRRRHNLGLSSKNRELKKRPISEERFVDLLHIESMDEMAENGIVPIAPVDAIVGQADDEGGDQPLERKEESVPEKASAPEVNESSPKEREDARKPPAPSRAQALMCEWPIASQRSDKTLLICGKPVVEGHRLCGEHLRFAARPKRRLR